MQEELLRMKDLNHPNILKILAVHSNSTYYSKKGKSFSVVFLVLEYCVNGPLYEYLNYTGPFSEEVARKYFK